MTSWTGPAGRFEYRPITSTTVVENATFSLVRATLNIRSLGPSNAAQRFSTLAVTALDALAKVQVLASNTTDLVLGVVGYHR